MRKVQIYIEGQRLELFNDEQIQITSSVQNVQDIAKVFTDFSQSFTVPASPINNQIFQHFYQNDVDSSLDYQLRRDAKIEIDLISFRTGTIQLEKANLKKGMAESYTITFYGDVRTLQDYFGDDKLNVLDMSPYSHEYNGEQVKTRITSSSDYDVRYPLISSERLWTYGDFTSTDISQSSRRIHYSELFPAVKISRVFNAIETKYGIDFQGLFLSNKRFTNCFLWLKNRDSFSFYTDRKDLDFIQKYQSGEGNLANCINLDTNSIVFDYGTNPTLDAFADSFNNIEVRMYVNAFAQSLTEIPYLDVYANDNLITTITGEVGSAAEFDINVAYSQGIDLTYTFKARSSGSCTVDHYAELRLVINGSETDFDGQFYGIAWVDISDNIFIENVDISNNFPDIKVSDFVSGVLKQFNLTCEGINPTTFKIEPLEDWYSQGRILDVTKHIDINSIDVERTKLYKSIKFEREKSETILNRAFGDANFREYGDLEQIYNYDGSDYVVKLPFENILHTKFTGTDLQVGYSLDKNASSIITKPVLLYMNEQKSCSFYYNNGTTTTQITNYMPFGQDLIYNGLNYSLNFGWDNSSFYLTPIQNNIFMTYYYNYLANLYSKKQRITYCKAYFPTAILSSIKMNDRLKIRDKRYIINEIKTNITTGDIDLVLLHDFRQLRPLKAPKITKDALTISYGILFPNDVVQVELDLGSTGITANKTSLSESEEIIFTFPSLAPSYTFIAENSDDLITEDSRMYFRSEENNTVVYAVKITYTYQNGIIEDDFITFTQEV